MNSKMSVIAAATTRNNAGCLHPINCTLYIMLCFLQMQ